MCGALLRARRESGLCSLLTPGFVDADRLLMPSFSTAKVRDMFDDMADICEQMITKWER